MDRKKQGEEKEEKKDGCAVQKFKTTLSELIILTWTQVMPYKLQSSVKVKIYIVPTNQAHLFLQQMLLRPDNKFYSVFVY